MEFLLITLPGLAPLVAKELEYRKITDYKILADSRVYVHYEGLNEFFKLRTIEGISQIICKSSVEEINTKSVRIAIRRLLRENKEIIEEFLKNGIRIKASVFPRELFSNFFLKLVTKREIKRVFNTFIENKKSKTLRIDLINNELYISVELVTHLHIRPYCVYKHPAMLNPLIASAIGFFLNISKNDLLLDPFLGSGTIPIEISSIFKNEGIGFDINADYVKGAILNCNKANLSESLNFLVANVRNPPITSSIDALVADPPRGLRLELPNLKEIYSYLLNLIKNCLTSNSKICIITPYENLLMKLAEKYELRIVDNIKVLQGGRWVSLVKLSF